MRIAPGMFWAGMCGDLGIDPEQWAQRFGLTHMGMVRKINAEAELTEVDGCQMTGQGKLPDDI
jgi:hypothetical protein